MPQRLLFASLAVALATSIAHAGEAEEAALRRRVDELERRLGALEAAGPATPQAGTPTAAPAPAAGGTADPAAPADASDPALTPPWAREQLTTPEALRGIYDKPFLATAWNRVSVGGYTELEYHGWQDEVLGVPRGFRAHRTNLFVFADVADRVRFGSEIEFENEEPGEDIEVAVEMAFVDWILYEELTLRGGVILAPLGRINVNHDGPVRELTDRPLVSTFVIPTTLSEAGVGLTGTIRAGASLQLKYEAYIGNGFALLDRDGNLVVPVTEDEQLLREGKPSLAGDNNKNVATFGRLGIVAFDALSLGGSWHVGKYDARGDNLLSIVAADLSLSAWIFSLEGELAWAGFERDAFARAAGVPDVYWGGYAQAGVKGMPEFLRELAPVVFAGDGAALGAVVRYDYVDLDGDRGEAIEPGVTFRPFADTVFKVSYRFGLKGLGIRDVPGREDLDDDGFCCGLATYF